MSAVREREIWHVEHALIDEGVPVARDGWCVVNQYGEVLDDSLTEDYESAELECAEWNTGRHG